MHGRFAAATAGLLALTALTGCTTGGESSGNAEPTPAPSTPSTPTTSTTIDPVPTDHASALLDLLDWRPVPGPVDDTVTRSSRTTVTVTTDNKTARIEGAQSLELGSGNRSTISTVLVDEQRVVVVVEDTLAERADEATVLDSSGGTAMLDGSSSPPTTTGGTWAMGQETLVHATVGDDGAYCLATVSLESGQGDTPWCAEPRHGFRGAVISDAGLSVMSFDDQRPVSCATLLGIDGSDATPFDGVTDCQGWDTVRLGDGAVWSEVPEPNRQDDAVFRARIGGQLLDLGAGTTGSLVYCAGAVYFVRDPQTDDDPARLIRVTTEGGMSIVYESTSTGNAFLSPPRCGGDAITLTSYGEQGDEQVTADLS